MFRVHKTRRHLILLWLAFPSPTPYGSLTSHVIQDKQRHGESTIRSFAMSFFISSPLYTISDCLRNFLWFKKVNSVERLTRHLSKGTPAKALNSYLSLIHKWVPDKPIIHIDDSDIVKPDGYKFEALGMVRDGSKSSSTKNVYQNGYHVTEACALTKNSFSFLSAPSFTLLSL